jgi:hypothetical protein
MFTAEEATKERVDAYVGALEHELEGYEARLKSLAEGTKERLDKKQLDALVAGVKAEIARVKKLKPAEDEDEAASEDEEAA